MALEIIKNINIDFYDKKYIMINAKQYDDRSRYIAITCYNQGRIVSINAAQHSAYVKYKKPDGYSVLNSCRINKKGEILVELTEQMLAVDGICYVDLTIVNKGSAMVNVDTGTVLTVDDSAILSTMAFCVSVYESPVENSEFESDYECNALNELLQKAEAEYTEVIQLSKSYAVGSAGGIRINEDADNAKYYYSKTKEIHDSVGGSLAPKGTIEFAKLSTADKFTGALYVIENDFVTDRTFAVGQGVSYPAGTIVYYTVDGVWACFENTKFSVDSATVDEVKSYLGI